MTLAALVLPLLLASPPLVPLSDVDPSIRQALAYAGSENFLGRPVAGYVDGVCRLTPRAAQALARAQKRLAPDGFGLAVRDCHRPAAAGRDFAAWVQGPATADPEPDAVARRARYHPNVPRADLMRAGYVASRSEHTAGTAVDVELVRLDDGSAVDLGTPFDFFDPKSAHGARGLAPSAVAARRTLAAAMRAAGFRAYRREWWHYALDPTRD
jgi:D-alanyl-D-alanine dipeptidase